MGKRNAPEPDTAFTTYQSRGLSRFSTGSGVRTKYEGHRCLARRRIVGVGRRKSQGASGAMIVFLGLAVKRRYTITPLEVY